MRQKLKEQFLANAGLDDYQIIELPMDASLRKYYRIKKNNESFILMDCPPSYTSIIPFLNIGSLLTKNNLRNPKIFFADNENGFILMEDLGDISIKELLLNNKSSTDQIYRNIIDLLISIQKINVHSIKSPRLETHSTELLLSGIETYLDFYLKLNWEEKKSYLNIWGEDLATLPDLGKVLVLRDFHVENLMSLDSSGKDIGILDFQDAIIGHPAYDLVSLLQDARYYVEDDLEEKMIDYYLNLNPNIDRNLFLYSYYLLGIQRNSRILGVFQRKIQQDNHTKYLEFIPTVQKYKAKSIQKLSLITPNLSLLLSNLA